MLIYRGYQIKPSKQFPASYVCATDGKGGKIPNVLDGLFTSAGLIKERIDLYLDAKETDNAKVSKS
jgi:hypothetical protein